MIATFPEMPTGPLFIKFQECTKKIVVVQGGGDAAKTVTILQEFAWLSVKRKNQVSTVVGHSVPAIKAGSLRTFQMYVYPYFRKYITKYNETERKYTFWNGSILEFKSYDDEVKAQGSERHNLFINECNHYTYTTFFQLERKTRNKVYLDYNPIHKFWVHEKVLEKNEKGEQNESQELKFRGRVQYYRVDHRHNPFLSKEDHDAYESISDPEMFRVYSRGLTGAIKGLVYTHFKKLHNQILLPEDCVRYYYSIDYGYTNDPTAIVKVGVKGRSRFVKELAYKTGLTADEIKNIIMNSGWKHGNKIYSEADPNMINQLTLKGMHVQPAIKGPGSIAAGISKVKEHEYFYTGDSANLELELGVYKWVEAEDIVTGRTVLTNVPIDAWNHGLDAIRMGDYTDSFYHRAA